MSDSFENIWAWVSLKLCTTTTFSLLLACWFLRKWLQPRINLAVSGQAQPNGSIRVARGATPTGDPRDDVPPTLPLSVNYHFTRQCNYSCGFCFHTAKTSFVLPMEVAKEGMQMLKKAGWCLHSVHFDDDCDIQNAKS